MGPVACRIALVISSLATSSVVKAMSSSPQSASCRVTAARMLETTVGSAGSSQLAWRSASSAWVRATSSATSSPGWAGSMAAASAWQVCSGGRSGWASRRRSCSRPASMSRCRSSMSPSVYRTSWLPGDTSNSAVSKGSPPSPSGGPAGSSRNSTVPSGWISAGMGCPARAMVQRLETGS